MCVCFSIKKTSTPVTFFHVCTCLLFFPVIQVAARFLLAKHREFVEEMYLDGFINEKVTYSLPIVTPGS